MQAHESASWAALGRRTSALRAVFVAAALAAIAVAASADVRIRVDAVQNSDPATHFHADNDANRTPPGGAIHGVAEAGLNGGPRSWRTAVPGLATSSCRCRVARFRCCRPGRWARSAVTSAA